jgi:hypothetical protein
VTLYLDIDEEEAPRLLDSERTGITREIEHAGTYLNNALNLWQMLDSRKAEALRRMLTEDLAVPREDGVLRLRRDQVADLITHLRDIESVGVGVIMDEDYHVLPGKIDELEKHAPGLAVRTTDAHGNPIYVLDKITEIEWLRAFLETALQRGYDVIQA